MTGEPVVFRKPPAVRVQAGLGFFNILEVAESRSKFYSLVKEDYPSVIIPEQRNCTYDFGDYALFSANSAHWLEISIGYFRLVSTSYGGFAQFRQMFVDPLLKFVEFYALKKVTNFVLQYDNDLRLPPDETLADPFAFRVQLPDSLEASYKGGKGILLFADGEDSVIVDLEPQYTEKRLSAYKMNLSFLANRQMGFKGDEEDVISVFDHAHDKLKNFFLSLLSKEYVNFLKEL